MPDQQQAALLFLKKPFDEPLQSPSIEMKKACRATTLRSCLRGGQIFANHHSD
jgi:hypothetical protein